MGELPEGKMCFCRSNALIPCSFCDSKINIYIYWLSRLWIQSNLPMQSPLLSVTCIKRSLFSWPVIENFISIEPLLRGHRSYEATFSSSQGGPLNTDLIVYHYFEYVIVIYDFWRLSVLLSSTPSMPIFGNRHRQKACLLTNTRMIHTHMFTINKILM